MPTEREQNGTKFSLKWRIQWAAIARWEHCWTWHGERQLALEAWKTWLQTETCHPHIYAAQTNWGLKNQQGMKTVCKASCLTRQICANTTSRRICVLAVCMCVRVCVYVSVEGVALRLPKGDLAAATAWISHCFQWTIVRLLLRGLDIMAEAFKGKQKCCFTKRTPISQE